MTGLLPCNQTPLTVCPPRFRIAASRWIDMRNVGDVPAGLIAPAGVRLRWNCPAIEAQGAGIGAYPDSFTVMRSAALDPASLTDPAPTVGHEPTIIAPSKCWTKMARVSGSRTDFAVQGGPCDGAQAVLIVMDAAAHPVTVSLVSTDGTVRVTGELHPSDRFYYELADLRLVTFSTEPKLAGISNLLLSRSPGELRMESIATIDARAWLKSALNDVSERLATASGGAFITITNSDWDKAQAWGIAVADGLDRNSAAPGDELLALLHAMGRRWEAATMMGWGFLDGEHPRRTKLDKIDRTLQLKKPGKEVYAYQVVAEFPAASGVAALYSELTCAAVVPMPRIEPATVRHLVPPRMTASLTNHVDQAQPGAKPIPSGQADEQPLCTTSWEIELRGGGDRIAFTAPMASPSAITGTQFNPVGTFANDAAGRPLSFRGLSSVQERDHDFVIPFYDSEVWLGLSAGDCWDRRIEQRDSAHEQPLLDYKERALPIEQGRTTPAGAAGARPRVDIEFDTRSNWKADLLSRSQHGEIEILMRDPSTAPVSALMMFGPCSLDADRNWVVEAETDLSQIDLSKLAGGTLTVGTLTARIVGFGRLSGGKATCTFEAASRCAGADLYPVSGGKADATCTEDEGSARLWVPVGRVGILADGSAASMAVQLPLPPLDTSQMLYFTSRIFLTFRGHDYRGPLSQRVAVPYIHPAPAPPEACFDVRNLAVDYYGRTIVRAEADGCEFLDVTMEGSLSFAPGIVSDSGALAKTAEPGLYGAQPPFNHRVMFDAFTSLTGQPEGGINTVGVSYVRPSDTRKSEPEPCYFAARRVD